MVESEKSQDPVCGSPSSGFLSAGLPVSSKTYRRPSPLRQRLQTQSKSKALRPTSFSNHVRSGPKTSTNISVTPISSGSGDSVNSSKPGYERLQVGEIRLLCLLRSENPGTSIDAVLSPYKLEDFPKYTAISYAWGDRRSMSTIRVNGETSHITTSLWHALTALRRSDRSVLVWVDALSINQDDIEELSCQVRIMDSIYSQAETVAACLGPHSDNSQLAFHYLRNMSGTAHLSSPDWIASESEILSFVRLFERDYWKRLWIMQEVFHASKTEVYCGSDGIPLGNIVDACRLFNRFSHRIDGYFPGGTVTETSQSHYSYAQILTTQGPNTLLDPSTDLIERPLEILRTCRNKLAARPQDKVIGVLSLLPEYIRSNFQPDFHLTPQEVFTQIVVSIVDSTGSLDIICESIRYPFHQNSFGLPSWVPDWSHSPDTLSLAATHLTHRQPFRACSIRMVPGSSVKRPLLTRDELRIHGIQIGTVRARGMAVGTLGRLSDYLMAFLEWRHLILDESDYGRESKAEFCRTLCLGDIPGDICETLSRRYGLRWSIDLSTENGSASIALEQFNQWQQVTFDLFAGFLGERLGRLPLDAELQSHNGDGHRIPGGRQFLQDYFGDRMMGRCFCMIEGEDGKRHMGMGTGYMGVDDLVVITYGCSTPIILRPTNHQGKYEFIGDIYEDGFMDGELKSSQLSAYKEREFILC